ncbi:MAG: uracil-DNA glycosylase family protein [Ginsengibacter sp.]
MNKLLINIKKCEVCKEHLPLGPRPVVQINFLSRIIIIGQAPGRRVHESGIPWNDASGKKLREWLNVEEAIFYNPDYFSIIPMGFCYPGKNISGDLPPRSECAPLWHPQILKFYKSDPIILLIGQYAQRYYLKKDFKGNLTETVKSYKEFLPEYFPLPHPSPRNQNWVKINPWFSKDTIPALQKIIRAKINLK